MPNLARPAVGVRVRSLRPQKSNELSTRFANTTNTAVCILHVSSIQSIKREAINERRSVIHPSYEVRHREDYWNQTYRERRSNKAYVAGRLGWRSTIHMQCTSE